MSVVTTLPEPTTLPWPMRTPGRQGVRNQWISRGNPTVLELAQVVTAPAGVEPESADGSRAHLGAAFVRCAVAGPAGLWRQGPMMQGSTALRWLAASISPPKSFGTVPAAGERTSAAACIHQ